MSSSETKTEIRIGDLVGNFWNDDIGVVVKIVEDTRQARTLYQVHTENGIINLWYDTVVPLGLNGKEI